MTDITRGGMAVSDKERVETSGQVVSIVRQQFGEDMATYVEQSMATDQASPFARMVTDALTAKCLLEQGDREGAEEIIARYREMANGAGFGAQFSAMMESIGLGDLT